MRNRLLGLGLFLVSFTFASTIETYRYFRIPASQVTEEFVKQSGFIQDHYFDTEFVIGYLPESRTAVWSSHLRTNWVELDPKVLAHQRIDLKTLKAMDMPVESGRFEDFHTYETLTSELQSLAAKAPDKAALMSAGKSVEGRELWYLRISNQKSGIANKPKLLYVSSMHGDEVTGKELMVYLIRELLTQYGRDARITRLVDSAEIFIMPSMNPDGTQHQQRFNAKGVDLNRDFPELNEQPFSGGRATETEHLMDLHRNNNFLLALNFHGGSLCVNLPWDSKVNHSGNLFGDDTVMHALARNYADNNRPMTQNNSGNFDHGVTYGYEWYPVYGGMQDWASFFRQAIHATVELSYPKWPSASALPTYWKDNRESLLGYLEGGLMGLHLQVMNPENQPLDVDVAVASATRTLHYTGGVVHRLTLAGDQKVTVTAPGYQTVQLTIPASSFQGEYKTIVMQKK